MTRKREEEIGSEGARRLDEGTELMIRFDSIRFDSGKRKEKILGPLSISVSTSRKFCVKIYGMGGWTRKRQHETCPNEAPLVIAGVENLSTIVGW